MSDEDKRLGHNIKRLREAAGLSQAELAESLQDLGLPGIHPQTITKVELGQRVLKFLEGVAIAEQLHVEPKSLVDGGTREQWERMVARRTQEVTRSFESVIASVRRLAAEQQQLDLTLAQAQRRTSGELSERIVSQARVALAWTTEEAQSVLDEVESATRREGFAVLPEGLDAGAYGPELLAGADGEHSEAP